MAENQKGTFIVKINHTDNASWQGQVTWADKNITKNFRSTLELIKLMDGAITSEETKNIFNVYEERYPLYEEVAHIKIGNEGSITDAVQEIIEALPNTEK